LEIFSSHYKSQFSSHALQVFHIEDIIEHTGYILDEDSTYSLKQSQLVQVGDGL